MTPESRILAALQTDALLPTKHAIARGRVGHTRGRRALSVLLALGVIEQLAYRSAYLYRRVAPSTPRTV